MYGRQWGHSGRTKITEDRRWCNGKPYHSSQIVFEIIIQSSSSAKTTEKTKDNLQTTSEDVIQEPIKEFQVSTCEDENKDSKYIESTREELEELFTTNDEDLLDIQKSENKNRMSYNCQFCAEIAIDFRRFLLCSIFRKSVAKVSPSEDKIQEWTDESVWFAPSEPTTNNEI
ncbi:hypothetical protein CEXT_409661 [Caerostris extrusa]|uniref:Uncharacterized protein n=1 Tax=Caerostris extrusa TaxID=172846 RepID=A0AAV4RN14_CAEEX|nr:hypothetical protein CEXT_409661 [Caerostris extrusa]